MSSEEEAGFPIEENSDGSFSVNIDGKIVCVETEEDAGWLSILPVELNNIFTNTLECPNIENIRRIIEVYKDYNITCFGIRKLNSWYKNNIDQ